MKELNRNAYSEAEEKPGYGVWLSLLMLNIGWGSSSLARALMSDSDSIDEMTLGYSLIMFVIGVLATICFFIRSKFTPKLFIAFLLINFLYFVIGSLFIWHYEGGMDYFGLIRIIVLCMLAIPYLLISKRVKEVFIN